MLSRTNPSSNRINWIVSFLILLAAIGAIVVLGGCGSGSKGLLGTGGGAALTGISLTPSNPTITLSLGSPATLQFDVIGHYSFGNPKDITDQMIWLSADTTVATVDSKGVASAVDSGRVVVTATIQDPQTQKIFEASTILTVVPQLTGITITPASAQIAKGTAQRFTATGQYNDGTSPDISAIVSWNSTEPAVASVSSSPGNQGLAVGQSAGSTSVSASLGGVSSGSSSLTVSNASLSSLSIGPNNPTVGVGTSQQLAATGAFDDGTHQDVSGDVAWTTVNPHSRVANVSAMGVVTGLGLGAETITATAPSSGITASTGVTVDESSVAAVKVFPLPMVMFPTAATPEPVVANGTRQQMHAAAILKDGSALDITGMVGIEWSSSDTSVATIVPDTGFMSTAGPGITTLTAALGSKQGTTAASVIPATLQSLVVAPNNAQLALGGLQNVVALATFLAPDNLTLIQQDVSNAANWIGDANASISYVNGLQELATGVATGPSNITATFGVPEASPLTGTSTLNVTSAQLSTINLSPGSASVPLDGSRQFLAIGNYTDGSQVDLSLLATWGSLDDAVTTVSPFGFSRASGPGQTSIGASFVNPVTGNPVSGAASVLVNPAALVRIDICAATVSNPIVNCPPVDPTPPPPGISFADQTLFGLVAIGTFSDGSRQDLTDAVRWTSANPDVATVSNDPGIPGITTGVGRRGVLTGGILGGTATVSATAGSVSGSMNVAVSGAVPQTLAIAPANGVVALGIPQQCKVSGTFSDGSKQDVTQSVQWSTLNPDIAIVYPGGLAYTTGRGVANVSTDPSRLVVNQTVITATMVNPSATNVFPWPVGTVFQFHGLTVSSGDVSLLNEVPLTIVGESDPADSQHIQPCKPGLGCDIRFAPPAAPPMSGTYTVTAGTGQASALITATMNILVNNTLTRFSGATTLTVQ